MARQQAWSKLSIHASDGQKKATKTAFQGLSRKSQE